MWGPSTLFGRVVEGDVGGGLWMHETGRSAGEGESTGVHLEDLNRVRWAKSLETCGRIEQPRVAAH